MIQTIYLKHLKNSGVKNNKKHSINLVKDENLSAKKHNPLIEEYLYAEREPLRDEILDLLEGEQPISP